MDFKTDNFKTEYTDVIKSICSFTYSDTIHKAVEKAVPGLSAGLIERCIGFLEYINDGSIYVGTQWNHFCRPSAEVLVEFCSSARRHSTPKALIKAGLIIQTDDGVSEKAVKAGYKYKAYCCTPLYQKLLSESTVIRTQEYKADHQRYILTNFFKQVNPVLLAYIRSIKDVHFKLTRKQHRELSTKHQDCEAWVHECCLTHAKAKEFEHFIGDRVIEEVYDSIVDQEYNRIKIWNNSSFAWKLRNVKQDEFGKRIHWVLTSIRKFNRKHLYLGNHKFDMVELDISQAQPRILSEVLSILARTTLNPLNERTPLTDSLNQGKDVYETIAKKAGITRDKAKTAFFKIFYGKTYGTEEDHADAISILGQNSWNTLNWIKSVDYQLVVSTVVSVLRKLGNHSEQYISEFESWLRSSINGETKVSKSARYKNVAMLLQRTESFVMRGPIGVIKEVTDRGLPTMLLHDAVYCSREAERETVEIFQDALNTFFRWTECPIISNFDDIIVDSEIRQFAQDFCNGAVLSVAAQIKEKSLQDSTETKSNQVETLTKLFINSHHIYHLD